MTPFIEFGLIIAAAALLGVIASFLKQPPLIGYIVAGLLLGPLAVGATNGILFHTLSDFGITLLMFLVGLELQWQSIRRVGAVAAKLAVIQLAVMLGIGYGLGTVLGLPTTESLLIGLTLGFSSTIVVVKLLAAKNDLQSLSGKLSVGILLLQDLLAIMVLILLPSFSQNLGANPWQLALLLLGKLAVIFIITWLMARVVLPTIWHRLAHNRELLLVGSIAWCFGLAIVAKYLGFSYEIGAFAAGLSLAATPYSHDITSQVRPVRDFFIVIFFVLLGFSLAPTTTINWALVAILTVGAVLLKPLVLMAILLGQQFKVRTAFLTAFSLGQMSEFSVILITTASALGLVAPSTVTAVMISVAISLAISSYQIRGANLLFLWFKPILMGLEHQGVGTDHHLSLEHVEKMNEHVIIFGYHRMGFHILRSLKKLKQDVLVVDFNPDVIERLRRLKVPSVFGDVADPDLIETVNAKQAKIVISTIPHLEENLTLINAVRRHKVVMITTATDINDALAMYRAGADYVIMPHFLSGEHLAEILERYEAGTLKTYLSTRKLDTKLARTREQALYFE